MLCPVAAPAASLPGLLVAADVHDLDALKYRVVLAGPGHEGFVWVGPLRMGPTSPGEGLRGCLSPPPPEQRGTSPPGQDTLLLRHLANDGMPSGSKLF